MPVPPFIAEAKRLYIKGDTQGCITYLNEQLTKDKRSFDLLDLQRRYNSLQQKVNRGIINHDDEKIELNQINNSLLNLIQVLESGEEHVAAVGQPVNTQRKWLYAGVGLLLLAVLIYAISSLVDKPTVTEEKQAEAGMEQAVETEDEQPVTPIDCGKYGKLVNGECECVNAYTGERCEIRVAPTKHITDITDQTYYAIESVALPGWSISVRANGQEPTDYFELQETSPLFNGERFQLVRSPKNDHYRIKAWVRGGGLFTAERGDKSNPLLKREFNQEANYQAFRFLAVGDDGYFSIQPLSHPNLYLTSSGEGGHLYFTESYTDPQTLFKLRAVTMGTY